MQRTRKLILDHINRHGASIVDDLAAAAGVVAVTVRAHLAVLEREGLVVGQEVRTGRAGRPRIHYALTLRAQDVFPKGYDHLAGRLLETVGSDEARGNLIKEAGTAWAASVAASVPSGNREERLRAAVSALDETGCETEWHEEEEGRLQITLHNCPYPAVVERFPQLCDMERTFLEDLLQFPVTIVESGPGCSECVMVAKPRPITESATAN
jgi:predicted ArsR family transcriptional regulator